MAKRGEGKATVQDIIIERLVERIKSVGVLPWDEAYSAKACNHITGRAYTGINRVLLGGGEWMTFKQLVDMNKANGTNFRLVKGCRKEYVVYCNTNDVEIPYATYEKLRAEGKPVMQRDGKYYRKNFVWRYYKVFPIDQMIDEDTAEFITPAHNVETDAEAITASDVMQKYLEWSGVTLEEDSTDLSTWYTEMGDTIHIPPRKEFSSPEELFRALFYEAIHSTGIRGRLGRGSFITIDRPENANKEEVIANMGSLLLASECGFKETPARLAAQPDGYLDNWVTWFENNKSATLSALSAAGKAADYVLHCGATQTANASGDEE